MTLSQRRAPRAMLAAPATASTRAKAAAAAADVRTR